jgi:multisubunit Na+/H+ antiporter MnhC subunit
MLTALVILILAALCVIAVLLWRVGERLDTLVKQGASRREWERKG